MKTKITSLLLCLALAGACGCGEEEETAWSLPQSLNGRWLLTNDEGISTVVDVSATDSTIWIMGTNFENVVYSTGQFTGRYDHKSRDEEGRISGTMHDRNTISISISVLISQTYIGAHYTGTRYK